MPPLFEATPQNREARAIWKFFRTPSPWALCNDWCQWFALNIPMSLVDGGFNGDLDIIVSMPDKVPPTENVGSRYRVFEVKSILVHSDGVSKSIKTGKTEKMLKQLRNLEHFGCPNIFLFEIHILQAGFSQRRPPMPKAMHDALNKRFNTLKETNYGYLLWAHEALIGKDEDYAAMWHNLHNLIVPKQEMSPGNPFLKLAEKIKDFHKEVVNIPESNRGLLIISYCPICKKLIPLYTNEEPTCPVCRRFVL